MKKLLLLIIIVGLAVFAFQNREDNKNEILTFEDCVAEGNPVMESYPRQCNSKDGKHFVENIGPPTGEAGNELDKRDLIRIDSPRPGGKISSPLQVTGEARGYWFFEANAPIALTDWDGRIISQSYVEVTAPAEWMTENFVPFHGTINFEVPEFNETGTLILQKSNASGLPEHDDALEIPVIFDQTEVKFLNFRVGDQKSIDDLKVKLVDVVEDGRCPADATCIWAGTVKIKIELTYKNKTQEYILEMNKEPISYNGYAISISRVEPPTSTEKQISKNEYSVTIKIKNE